jgi:hypothetical protein
MLLRISQNHANGTAPSVVDCIRQTPTTRTKDIRPAPFTLEAAVWSERLAEEHAIDRLALFSSAELLPQLRAAWPPRFLLNIASEHVIELEELTLERFLALPAVRGLLPAGSTR